MAFGDDLRNILLAGVGAVAVTAEKAKAVVEDLIAKGELTVEQGKVLNEELKQKICNKVDSWSRPTADEIMGGLGHLTEEELRAAKEKIAALERAHADKSQTPDDTSKGEEG